MKKRSLLPVLLILPALVFTTRKDNNVKACYTNSPAGEAVKKCRMMKVQAEYMEDTDASFSIFTNPFKQL